MMRGFANIVVFRLTGEGGTLPSPEGLNANKWCKERGGADLIVRYIRVNTETPDTKDIWDFLWHRVASSYGAYLAAEEYPEMFECLQVLRRMGAAPTSDALDNQLWYEVAKYDQ